MLLLFSMAFCLPNLVLRARTSNQGNLSHRTTSPRKRPARWNAVTIPHNELPVAEIPKISDGTSFNKADNRLSKIVCTLGPKTCDVESIELLADRGMDVVRLNMSHGTHEWHRSVIENVRTVNAKKKYILGILLDTKGPEVRSGDLRSPINISRGQRFTWTIRKDTENFSNNMVDVSYDDFVKDVHVGDTLLVDGGMCSFLVTEVTETDVVSECIDRGILTSRRHLNVRGKSASLPAITEKDWEDIKLGMEMGVDFYALSFVRHEDDVTQLKEFLRENNVNALVLSKIESADAVTRLRQILEASDGAMVARGDLGAEIALEDVPLVQEEIVGINRALRRPTIVATHMLESMIAYSTPTRAEVTDITEAVKQGADATMLSGETANGAYPLEAVRVMATVARSVVSRDRPMPAADILASAQRSSVRDAFFTDPRLDLAYAASNMASQLDVAAMVVFTRSGTYARLVSSTRPKVPVIAFTPDSDLTRRLTLLWGIDPVLMDFTDDPEDNIAKAVSIMLQKEIVKHGDILVIASDMLSRGDEKVNSIQVRRAH